jgi:hypothetical protein
MSFALLKKKNEPRRYARDVGSAMNTHEPASSRKTGVAAAAFA